MKKLKDWLTGLLIPDWKEVMKRSYSCWFILAAAVFTGLEVAIPFLPIDVAPGTFALISGSVSAMAYVGRLLAQKSLSPEIPENL